MKKFFSLFLIFFIAAPLFANVDKLNIDFDFARFKGAQNETNLELYYCLYPAEWNVIEQSDGSYLGAARVELVLFQDQQLVYSNKWKMDARTDSTKQSLQTQKIVDLLRFSLPAGSYQSIIYVEDMNSSRKSDSLKRVIDITPFTKDSLMLSDLEISQKITRSKKANVFTKNNLDVIPDPQGMLDKSRPILYYYFEVYNILAGLATDEYQVELFIGDSEGGKVEDVHPVVKNKKKSIDSSVEVGTLNISKLPSGAYYLYSRITDNNGNQLIQRKKQFYTYHPEIDATVETRYAKQLEAEIAVLSEQEVTAELQYIQYLLPKGEIDKIKMLSETHAKRQYLSDFWRNQNPDPSKPRNMARQNFLQRVKIANDQFSGFRDGWKTDRGRVIIIYGMPSDIQRYPSSATAKAYQIWSYEELQGGVEFIFVDITGFNKYEMIHSTCRGERIDYNWQDYVEQ